MKNTQAFPSADGLWTGLRLAPGAAPDVQLDDANASGAIGVGQGRIRWGRARGGWSQ